MLTWERAGVIPYTMIEGDIYLCLGYDVARKVFSDFGGGREKKELDTMETIYETASRELYEESIGCFYFSPEIIQAKYTGCVHNSYSITFFIYVPLCELDMENLVTWFNIQRNFYEEKRESEISQLLNEKNEESKKMIKNKIDRIDHLLENYGIAWFSLRQFYEMLGNNREEAPNLIGGLKKTIRRYLKVPELSKEELTKIINNRKSEYLTKDKISKCRLQS